MSSEDCGVILLCHIITGEIFFFHGLIFFVVVRIVKFYGKIVVMVNSTSRVMDQIWKLWLGEWFFWM